MTSLEIKALAIILAIAGLFAAFKWQEHEWTQAGIAQCQAATAAAVAKQVAEADAKTETLKESAHELAKANAIANSSVDARLAANLQRLRNRPASAAVVPQVAGSAASYGHVGGLPVGDSDLLALGARAARLQAKLAECQAWIAQVSAQQ